MRWIWYIILATLLHSALAEEDSEENDLALPPPPINLDSNLRKALLKALQELENEENEKNQKTIHSDRVVEKASASSVSIFTNSETISAHKPIADTTAPPQPFQKPLIVIHKSEGVQKPTITTIEKNDEILTSASNSFALSNQENSLSIESKSSKSPSTNLIESDEKTTVKLETTTETTTTSTEENEAKVEEVQFFSAPLVAAFTVHQDELGLPKKVETLFKISSNVASQSNILTEPDKLKQDLLQRQEELLRNQKIIEEELLRRRQEAELQQKQKVLEQEISRLNENLKKQTELNLQQQQQNLLLQQEQHRLKTNNQFTPIVNSGITSFNQPQLSVKESNFFNTNEENVKGSVSLLPSLTIDPLVLASRLPLNARQLPIREPVNFNAPVIPSNTFQSFSINQQFPPFQATNNNRFNRQEIGVGNFVNNDNFSQKSNSFSFLKSIEGAPIQTETFLRNSFNVNKNNNLLTPNLLLLPPEPISHNRIFRSNFEDRPLEKSQHLGHLLQNSGALNGKVSEDFNIITKVLSLNHFDDNNFAGSTQEQRVVAPDLKRA